MIELSDRDRLDVVCALRLAETVVRRRARDNGPLRAERLAKADRMARLRTHLDRRPEAIA